MMSQQHAASQQQQQQQMSQQRRSSQRPRNMASPETIAVIVNGWPSESAISAANACAKRGFRIVPFGLATNEAKENSLSVHQVPEISQPVRLVKFSDAQAKQELQRVIQEERSKDRFVVVVDTSEDAAAKEHVSMYNELQVPFVLESKGGEQHQQAVRDTELARSSAMITEQMNKRMSAMDQMWREWSRRFPGLFDDFDFSIRSSRPSSTPKSLMDSFSDLVNRELGLDVIEPLQSSQQGQQQGQQQQQQPPQKRPTLEGHLTREYTFKNGSGSSTYTFHQSVNDVQEFAEGVADSVGFLAQKAQEMARPQVYSILDVAAQPSRYLMNI